MEACGLYPGASVGVLLWLGFAKAPKHTRHQAAQEILIIDSGCFPGPLSWALCWHWPLFSSPSQGLCEEWSVLAPSKELSTDCWFVPVSWHHSVSSHHLCPHYRGAAKTVQMDEMRPHWTLSCLFPSSKYFKKRLFLLCCRRQQTQPSISSKVWNNSQ